MDTDIIKQPFSGLGRKPKIFQPVIHKTNLFYLKTLNIITILLPLCLFLGNSSTYIATVSAIETNKQDPLSLPSDSIASGESDNEVSTKEVDKCEACKLVVSSFEKGLEETSRGKHEGGDTSWEERNLKSYADSEVRLVEIQERLCEDAKKGKPQCLSLAEDTESDVEEWWSTQRKKNVRLLDYLCISKLKVCCASKNFGPNCQSCPSDCNRHGICDGAGTRLGSGKCVCETGYHGEECENCADNHFRIATSGQHFTCQQCDSACEGCYGFGKTNCIECRTGYYKHETSGCIDINECDIGLDGNRRLCKGNSYCVNTDGAYRCAECHMSCSGCVGYGPNMCLACARGYQLDHEYTCRSEEEMEKIREWNYDETLRQGKSTAARYFFYVGVLAVSVMMFRSNLYVMYTFTLGFVVLLAISEFNLLDEARDYAKISSE